MEVLLVREGFVEKALQRVGDIEAEDDGRSATVVVKWFVNWFTLPPNFHRLAPAYEVTCE